MKVGSAINSALKSYISAWLSHSGELSSWCCTVSRPRGESHTGGEKDSSVMKGSGKGENRSLESVILRSSAPPNGSNTSLGRLDLDFLDFASLRSFEPLMRKVDLEVGSLEIGVAWVLSVGDPFSAPPSAAVDRLEACRQPFTALSSRES